MTSMTELTLLDSTSLYQPLPPLTLPHALEGVALPSVNVSCFFRSSRWATAIASARATGSLRVTVIGASSTMGCGSCDFAVINAAEVGVSERRRGCPFQHAHRLCSPEHSWVRQMQDGLSDIWSSDAALASASAPPHTTVWAKNAVGPGYFLACPTHRLPMLPRSHVILIELASNLFFGSLKDLVSRLQAIAPQAAVAILLWPPQATATRKLAEETIATVARKALADVYDIGAALDKLPLPRRRYYAQNGNDNVHPNAVGHQMLGRLAARGIADSLRLAVANSRTSGVNMRTVGGLQNASAAAAARGQPWEQCYDHRLPMRTASGNRARLRREFDLIDEGVAKGIPKLGWVSQRPGQKLVLGPLPGPPNRTCALLKVSLLHLATTIREAGDGGTAKRTWPGELHLECKGCSCISEQVPFHLSIAFPMDLPTNVNAGLDLGGGAKVNMSVTRAMNFLLLWRSDTECLLSITHAPPRDIKERWSIDASKVRVDGLAMASQNLLLFASHVWAPSHRKSYPAGYRLVTREVANSSQCRREAARGCTVGRMNASGAQGPKSKAVRFCEEFVAWTLD